MFEAWGRFVYRRRWYVLIVSAVLLGLSVAGILTGGTLAGNGGFGADLAAGKAAKLVAAEIQPEQAPTGSGMELVFISKTLTVTDPGFQSAVEQSIAPLLADARVTGADTPYNVSAAAAQSSYISKDAHKALVIVRFKDSSLDVQKYLSQVIGEIPPSGLQVLATGQVPINLAFNNTLEQDLQRAEYVALPITLLLLVLIFASFVAALLPISVGVLAIVGGVGAWACWRSSAASVAPFSWRGSPTFPNTPSMS